MQKQPKLLDQVRNAIRYKHYSLSTEKAYVYWIRFYIRFNKLQHPSQLGKAEVEQFLKFLINERSISASTHRQALSAILFLYKEVINQDLAWLTELDRPSAPKRLPTYLSRQEVQNVFQHLESNSLLISMLLYGTGMRIMEVMRLRTKDIDFEHNSIVIRAGKGDKDRVVMLPSSIKLKLYLHLQRTRQIWEKDRNDNIPGVEMPQALEKKYPRAPASWAWFWVFPQGKLSTCPRTLITRRHHYYPQTYRRHFQTATTK